MSNIKKNEENDKLRLVLLTALNKMNSPSTVKVCHETLKKLINEEEKNENKINFILNTIAEHINYLHRSDKKESIKLLSTVCTSFKNISTYLSRILTILQTNITDDNSSIFSIISSTFGEIVDYTANILGDRSKTNYELLQGFCIYNMKIEKKSNQICGSLCLTSLIENSAMVLEPAYMKYIWENIIYFIDKNNFFAKSELINSLISLIFASENLFKPFATVTLYKILDFLTDGDWLKRKLALNVVYTLVIYSQEEIFPLKGHIVEFLKVLKCDKVKEVREVCMQTLKLLNTNDDVNTLSDTEETGRESDPVNKEKSVFKENEKKNNSPSSKINKKTEIKESEKMQNFKMSKKIEIEISKIEKKSVNNSRLDFDNSNLNELITANDSLFEDKKENKRMSDVKNGKEKKKLPLNSKNEVKNDPNKTNKIICENQQKVQISIPTKTNSKNLNKTMTKTSDKLGDKLNTKDSKINRNSDNSFVNSKMIIKRDKHHSIFNTKANIEFFSKAKNVNSDIQVLYKEQTNENNLKNNSRDNHEEEIKDFNTKKQTGEEKKNAEKSIHDEEINHHTNRSQLSDKSNNSFVENEKLAQISYSTYHNQNSIIKEEINYETKSVTSAQFISNNYLKMNPQNAIQDLNFETISNRFVTNSENTKIVPYKSELDRQLMSNINTNNKVEMSDILKQMKIISEKQIFLVETIEQNQENFKSQFDQMNKRINLLENTVNELTSYIKSNNIKEQNEKQPPFLTNKTNKNDFNTKRPDKFQTQNNLDDSLNDESYITSALQTNNYIKPNNKNENIYQKAKKSSNNKLTDIFSVLKNNHPNEAFNIALDCNDEINLLKLINKISITQLKATDTLILEDAVIRLVSLLLRGENTRTILPFLKNIIVIADFPLKSTLLQNIKDILLHIPNNKQKFNLTDEELADIDLILSNINTKNKEVKGYATIQQKNNN